MRTTLNIDDGLYRRVKAEAALRGCSVTSLLEESLRLLLAAPLPGHAVRPLRVAKETGSPFAGVDLHDARALRDLLDGDGAGDAPR